MKHRSKVNTDIGSKITWFSLYVQNVKMQKYRKYPKIFLKSDIFDISENITIFSNLQHAPKRYILSTPCVSLYFLYQIKSNQVYFRQHGP